jgi:putative ABC transport system permease protein
VGGARPALVAVAAGALALLVAACANVAALLLARSARGTGGLAVRVAMGARRAHLARHLGAEAVVLALLGAAGGAVVAAGGVAALRAAAPAGLPRADELAVDARVLGAALALSLVAAALVSLVPAWRAARTDARAALAGGARAVAGPPGAGGQPRGAHRARGGLVAGQLALALVLVAGAGLLVRSVAALARADRGFRADHVASATLFAWQEFPGAAARAAFVRAAAERLGALPGVRAAGAGSTLPLASPIGMEQVPVAADGQPLPEDREARGAHLTAATPGYFDALRVPVRRGRGIAAADDARGEPVAVVNEAFARQFFAGRDPVGRTVRYRTGRGARGEQVRRVVGVVADVRQRDLAAPARPALFVPHAQAPTGALHFVVRTAGDPARALPAVRRALAALAPSTPVTEATTLDALVADALRERVFLLRLLGTFAGAALVLAAVGVYAALSERAAERRRELGVRVALGATAGEVARLVVGDGARVAALGLAMGAAAYLVGGRLLAAQLYGVGPRDPLTLAGGAAVLGAAALAACWLPARRAARVDPAAVLRSE